MKSKEEIERENAKFARFHDLELLEDRVKRGFRNHESVSRIISGCGRPSDQILPIIERYLNMKDFLGREYQREITDQVRQYREIQSRELRPRR